VLYEVYKHVRRLLQLVPLTEQLALAAADLSLEYKLAMADAIVLATAQAHDAQVVTRRLRRHPRRHLHP
jgi:predicted nucleic acid-binding protein